MDKVSKETRSLIMGKVKSSETKLEQQFRRMLWRSGVRYRKNNLNLYGKPDISNRSKNVAVFIDSCFWHGCPEHVRLPKSNIDYWEKKIESNRKRDITVNEHYRSLHWKIIRVWEHQLKKDPEKIVDNILKLFG